MKNAESNYPEQIDPRIFYSDMNLDTRETWNQYQNLINENKYTEASTLLLTSDADYYGAWLLNLLEDRLVKIGEHVLTLEKPELTKYQTLEPSDVKLWTTWIS